jgi:F-box interacting protein
MVNGVSKEHHFYSAKIQKGDTDTDTFLLGPAIKLPPIPFKSLTQMDLSQVRNGFLCHREDSQFYIFSADTGEVSTLPEVPTPEFPCDRHRLEFENRLEHYFGLDPLSNEPKVLLFQSVPAQGGPKKERFWIFTRGSGSWNRIHPSPPCGSWNRVHPSPPFYDTFRSSAFANGTIHWICGKKDNYSYPRQSILAFDLVEEKFREIPHPDDSFSGTLTTFGGRLALMEEYDGFEDELPCWILEDNGKWIKETIHFPFDWGENKEILAFDINTGEMLLSPQLLGEKQCLFYYNTKTRIFRTADLTGFPQWCQSDSLDPVEVKFDN